MKASDLLFAQNWIEQYKLEFYGEGRTCGIVGNILDFRVMEDGDDSVRYYIMETLHWSVCRDENLWGIRYGERPVNHLFR